MTENINETKSIEDNIIEVIITTTTPTKKGHVRSTSYNGSPSRLINLSEANSPSQELESDSESEDDSFVVEKKEKEDKRAIIHRRKSMRLEGYHVSDEVSDLVPRSACQSLT